MSSLPCALWGPEVWDRPVGPHSSRLPVGYVNGALRIGQGTTCACMVLSRDNFSLKFASRSSPCPLPISVCICLCLHLCMSVFHLSISLDVSIHAKLFVLFSVLILFCFSSLLISLIYPPSPSFLSHLLFCLNPGERSERLLLGLVLPTEQCDSSQVTNSLHFGFLSCKKGIVIPTCPPSPSFFEKETVR